MATGSSLIAALRGGPAMQAGPAASGLSFLNPMAQTAMPPQQAATLPSTLNALRGNNTYALDNPTMLTMRAGVVGGNAPRPVVPRATNSPAPKAPTYSNANFNDGLFNKGQGLNDQFGQTFLDETEVELPDQRPHGDRYGGELASAEGRLNLGGDLSLRNSNTADSAGSLYRPGDFDLLPGMSMETADGRQAYNTWMGSGENNSMFVPDKIEVDPGYWYNSPAASTMSPADQQTNWDQSYYGGRMLTAGNAADIRSPEWQLRDLMRETYRAEGGNANLFGPGQTANEVVNNLYADARAPVIAMDVGRGGLTPEQADAVNRATEYSTYLRRLGPEMDATADARSLYEGELSKYMDTVNAIDPNKTDLSSLALINALRGVENPELAGVTPGPARVLPDAPITFDQAFQEINSSPVISGSQADPEVRAAVLERVNESISNPAARENLISDIEQITGQTADQLGLTSSVVTTQPIEAPEANLSNQMNDLQRQINSFRYENYGSYDEAVNARNAMERQLGTIQRQLMTDGFFFDENTGTWVKR